jgi:Predicted membrane protein
MPDLLFLVFLAYTARRCYDILNRSPSMIMWTYYCLVWAVTLCNVFRTTIQLVSRPSNADHVQLWNVLWLLTRFIMTMLEVRITQVQHSHFTMLCTQVLLQIVDLAHMPALQRLRTARSVAGTAHKPNDPSSLHCLRRLIGK